MKRLKLFKKVSRKLAVSFLALVIVVVSSLTYFFYTSKQTEASWYNDAWGYRTKLTIKGSQVGGANEVFDIGHEAGSLSEYSSTTTDGGDLSVSSAAALNGSGYGLSAVIDDNNKLEAYITQNKSIKTSVRFYFDPNSVTMTNTDIFLISQLIQNGGSWSPIVTVGLLRESDTYYFSFQGSNDAGDNSWDTIAISDAPHYLEFTATQASTSSSNDGSYEWWVDGVNQGSVTGVDNYNRMSDYNWLSILASDGIETGTRGTVYFDDFVANSDGSPIGPAITDFPVYVDLSKLPAGFHNKVNQTDARDIRVTKGDGATELPREVVYYNATTNTGELYFKYTGTLSSSTDTDFYIYYGNSSATEPSASDTYGKNNVWTGYEAAYHLNENTTDTCGSGDDVCDSSGTGNNLSMNGNASYVSSAKMGAYAGTFDGSGDYLSKAAATWRNTLSAFTMEGWYYTNSLNSVLNWSSQYSLAFNINGGNQMYPRVDINGNGSIGLQLRTNGVTQNFTTDPAVIQTGTWQHIIITFTSSELGTIYVDGVEAASYQFTTGTLDGSTTGAFNVGYDSDRVIYYDGKVDELRMSNAAYSSGWAATQYNNQNSPSTFFTLGAEESKHMPILNLPFNEGYGTTAHDSSPNRYDGTLLGSTLPTWQNSEMCISEKCLYFNGSTAYVKKAIDTFQTTGSSGTIGVWVKPINFSVDGYVFSSADENSANRVFGLAIGTSGKPYVIAQNDGTADIVEANSALPLNTWSYILFTSSGSAWKIYINGIEQSLTVTSGSNSGAWLSSVGSRDNITIGALSWNSATGYYLNGYIDEFKMYDYVRSAAEIKADYIRWAGPKGSAAVLGAANPNIVGPISNGLVGYWKMDEVTNTTRVDLSGNSNTLIESTGDDIDGVGGKFSNAGDFENSSSEAEYLSIDDATQTGLDITGNLTVCAWINPESLPGTSSIAGKWSIGGTNVSYLLNVLSTGHAKFYVSNNGSTSIQAVTSPGVVTTGVWTHVCGLYDGQYLRIYINGTQTSEPPTSFSGTIYSGSSDFLIAGSWGDYFDGKIDEVRIYNRALSPAEVSQLYNFAPGPVGNWKMDENTGTSAYDSSGYGNTGTLTNSPTWGRGKYGSGVLLESGTTNKHISVPQATSINTLNQFTFSTWVYFSQMVNGGGIMGKSGNLQFYITQNGADFRPRFYLEFSGADMEVNTTSTANLTAGRWYHLAVTWDGSNSHANTHIYVNGVDQVHTSSTDSSGTRLSDSSSSMIIGNTHNVGVQTYGTIDDSKYYNYARTPGQITEDMNAGHPAPGSPVGSAVGHWKFNEGVDNTCQGGTNDVCNSGSGGSAFDGAQSGMAVPATSTSGWSNDGKFGKALSFDGSNDYVQITGLMGSPTSITLSAWANLTTSDTNGAELISLGDIVILRLDQYGANLNGTYFDGTDWRQTNYPVLYAGTGWHHFTYTINTNAKIQKLYVDGNEKASSSYTGAISYSGVGTNTFIGKHGDGGTLFDFNGKIDEVKIFASALTSDQVKLLYNQSSSISLGSVSTNYNGGTITASNSSTDGYCPPGQDSACVGPIGHWKLDENTGTTVHDTSGNGYNGTFGATPAVWSRGKIGSALKLSTTNDDVTIGNVHLNGLSAASIEIWVKRTVSGTDILVGEENASTKKGFNLEWYSDNKVYCQAHAGSAYANIIYTGMNDLLWHHIACVYDGSLGTSERMKMFIDGVLKTPTATNGTIPSAIVNEDTSFKFGSNLEATSGTIDEVKLYNYARTPAQIAWDMNRGAPSHWYKFNECQGTSLYNSAISANNTSPGYNGSLTLSGNAAGTCSSVTTTDTWYLGANGKYGSALGLDGNDYVSVSSPALPTRDFSYTAWIYLNNLDNEATILKAADGAGANEIKLAVVSDQDATHPNSLRLAVNGLSDYTTTKIYPGAWYHIAGTRDGSAIKTYINGVETSSSSDATVLNFSTCALVIGTSPGSSCTGTLAGYINGKIDDLRVYQYSLSKIQIQTLMNEGSAVRFGPLTGSP